jgi:hypothetical protein
MLISSSPLPPPSYGDPRDFLAESVDGPVILIAGTGAPEGWNGASFAAGTNCSSTYMR